MTTQNTEIITIVKKVQNIMQELLDIYDDVSEESQQHIDNAIASLSDAEHNLNQIS